ncbi:MAG: hypothetical protein KDB04_13390 [Acidimicrobiales bacterium]|nr:hypothetical protein [Acidimicrobiales bacterium]HRW36447.1 hypothetical protein [Aquihabitans sp.]
MRAWIIRAGEGGAHVDEFVDQGIVALGYDAVDDLRRMDRWDIERALERVGISPPDAHATILISFLHEVLSGDLVVMPDSSRGEVVVGVVDGPYDFVPGRDEDDHPHRRKVEWLARHPRTDLPTVLADVQRQRVALRRVDSPSIDDHLARVRAGEVGRPADQRTAPRPPRTPRATSSSAPRAPRSSSGSSSRARVTPRKAEVATRRCEACFQTKPVTQFDGDDPLCRDCA